MLCITGVTGFTKQKSHAWTTQDDSGLHALLKPDSTNIKGLLDGLSLLIRFHGLKADPGVTHVFRVNEGKDNVIMDFDGDTEKSIALMVLGAKKIVEIHSVDGQKRYVEVQFTNNVFVACSLLFRTASTTVLGQVTVT